jgi:hypothetical protein
VLLTDFCNRLYVTCTCNDRTIPGVPSAFAKGRPMERTPRDMPGCSALDGAPHASVDSAHAPADPAVTGTPDTLVGSDICEPSKECPPFRGVVFRGRRVRIDL